MILEISAEVPQKVKNHRNNFFLNNEDIWIDYYRAKI